MNALLGSKAKTDESIISSEKIASTSASNTGIASADSAKTPWDKIYEEVAKLVKKDETAQAHQKLQEGIDHADKEARNASGSELSTDSSKPKAVLPESFVKK
jgi:pyruvate/2-oxoglutarate dehydrogenase complex dihydrolipoamide dehydrogenase (E3) component